MYNTHLRASPPRLLRFMPKKCCIRPDSSIESASARTYII